MDYRRLLHSDNPKVRAFALARQSNASFIRALIIAFKA